jgi:hypothetical protein
MPLSATQHKQGPSGRPALALACSLINLRHRLKRPKFRLRVHTALPPNNEVKPPCRTPQGLQRAVPHSTISSFSEEDEHYEMAQAYHSVPLSIEHEVVEDGRETEHEGSALLGSRASGIGLVKSETQREGHATLTSCVGNLANTIIGSGACAVFLSPQFCRRRRISRSNDARS